MSGKMYSTQIMLLEINDILFVQTDFVGSRIITLYYDKLLNLTFIQVY